MQGSGFHVVKEELHTSIVLLAVDDHRTNGDFERRGG